MSVHGVSYTARRDQSWLNLNLQTNETRYNKPQHQLQLTHKDDKDIYLPAFVHSM
jgi:hypothetical protein